MKTPLCSLFAVATLASSGLAFAQEAQNGPAKPMFAVLPRKILGTPVGEVAGLPTWNGSFVYRGTTYTYNMVGAAPSTNTSVTVQPYIIPLKIIITKGTKTTTFDAEHVLSNGRTVIQNTIDSPIFDSTTNYTQGGVNLGTTQYIDAFQRGNFWGTVSTNTSYHLLLGTPKIAPEQTLKPPASDGTTGNPFGNLTVAEVDIDWFDTQIQSIMKTLKIPANSIPIFVTYDTYLTEGGCCIGGYHSAFTDTAGTIAYSNFEYIDKPGDFSQDVSALSHELGEWANDPLIANINGNQTPCGILEVGDPLEGDVNYGGFPYTVNGFTYNLQDMVFLPYFDAPKSTSVNGWLSFQNNTTISPCSNGS